MGVAGRIAEAEAPDFLPAGDIPDAHRAVPSPRDEPLAVSREGEAHDPIAVALEDFQLLAGAGVPENDVVRCIAHRQHAAVGRKGERERTGTVFLVVTGLQHLAGCAIEQEGAARVAGYFHYEQALTICAAGKRDIALDDVRLETP